MKKTILILTIILGSIISNAQEKQENILVFGVPQYLITNAIRIDIDIRKPNTNSWWIISPYYYVDKSNNDAIDINYNYDYDYNSYDYDLHEYDELYGFGLGIERKTIIGKSIKSEGFYLKYGVNYKNFAVIGNNFTFREYVGDDGITYQGLRDGKYTININSFNALTALGYQFELMSKLYLDTYLGFGVKYSTHSSKEKVTIKYNRQVTDYGYTGTQFIIGVRLGVAL